MPTPRASDIHPAWLQDTSSARPGNAREELRVGALDSAPLDGRRFVRIHRSAIVNIDMVDELRQDAHGAHLVLLRDSTQVRVGRRFRRTVPRQ